MRLSKTIMFNLTVILLMVSGIAYTASIEDLLSLHGEKYITARNELLDKSIEIIVKKNDNPRIDLLVEIISAWGKHPELFSKLPAYMDQAYKDCMQDLSHHMEEAGPYKISMRNLIKGTAARFMCQGIEKKEYVTYESPSGRISDRIKVEHIQSDEEVALAKELNRAAKLAIIEYLWRISDNSQMVFELSELLVDGSPLLPDTQFNSSLLVVFEDVFHRSDHFKVLETCIRLFCREKYDKAIPLARVKLDQCFKDGKYLSCLVLIPYVEQYGEKAESEKAATMRKEIDKIIEKQKADFEWTYLEIKRRIEAQEKAKTLQEPGLPAEEKPKNENPVAP